METVKCLGLNIPKRVAERAPQWWDISDYMDRPKRPYYEWIQVSDKEFVDWLLDLGFTGDGSRENLKKKSQNASRRRYRSPPVYSDNRDDPDSSFGKSIPMHVRENWLLLQAKGRTPESELLCGKHKRAKHTTKDNTSNK